jgi:RimJ/RimL family protein N-acetyltransferase
MTQAAAARPEVPLELRTPRLSLRAPHPDYAPRMVEAIGESLGELREWMEWAKRTPSLEESRAQQEKARASFLARDDLPLVLFRDERLVGGSGLHRIDWRVPCFEIGYWVRTPDRGQGYVTEAVRAIEELAFERLGARRVEIRMDVRNARSRAVPERLGYQLEGVLRHDCLDTQGLPRSTAVYAKIR